MTSEDKQNGGGNVTSIKSAERQGSTLSGDQHLERFAKSFEASARRWELVVYPSLFAFIVLASYGFYLVYSLTHDVGLLSRNVASLTHSIETMVHDMNGITGNMREMTSSMNNVSSNMAVVSSKMDSLEPMRLSMESMNQSARAMAFNTQQMSYYAGAMNHNIGRPMGVMNSFMPW